MNYGVFFLKLILKIWFNSLSFISKEIVNKELWLCSFGAKTWNIVLRFWAKWSKSLKSDQVWNVNEFLKWFQLGLHKIRTSSMSPPKIWAESATMVGQILFRLRNELGRRGPVWDRARSYWLEQAWPNPIILFYFFYIEKYKTNFKEIGFISETLAVVATFSFGICQQGGRGSCHACANTRWRQPSEGHGRGKVISHRWTRARHKERDKRSLGQFRGIELVMTNAREMLMMKTTT